MKSFSFYKQFDSMDCGPTCLKMVAKHYKRDIPIQYLREKTQIGKEGVNLLGISEAAEQIGFRTQAIKADYDVLIRDVKLPAILHWKQNHFVVLYRVAKGRFSIADPAKGLVNYSTDDFKPFWISDNNAGKEQGVVLVIEPSPAFYAGNFDTDQSRKLNFRNIIGYVLPHKKLIFQLMLGLGVASLLQVILPFLTQSIVDTGINTANIQFLYIVLLAQLALFTGRMVIEFVRSWILLHISTRINLAILTDFLVKLMKLPLSFFDSKHTGDIMQRMNDHSRIESFLTGSSLSTLFSLVNLVIFSMILAVFNVQIFFIFFASSILYSTWVILFLKKRKQLDYKRFEISAATQSTTIQLIHGMQEIKLYGVEKSMRWKWEHLQAKLFLLNMKGLSLTQWQQTGAFFINEGKNIFITFLSAIAVINGQMTLGSMLAVQYIIGQLNSPIEQMIGFIQSWQNAKISMDRLNEIHTLSDEEPADQQFQHELPPSFVRSLVGGRSWLGEEPSAASPVIDSVDVGLNSLFIDGGMPEPSIHLKNVSFTYPGAGNEPVLKNINLSIPKGKTTAIVGVSGSGKTTLLKLLLKFCDPQKGEIMLDRAFLRNMSHKAWRRHCGVVMQESYIFSDTIAKNIAVGAERVDMEKLLRAVEAANIRDFIETLPLGFNTKIGAEGTGLSMGQKQRVLIARAVYRDPDFIFLDEATNSLDANNESIIISNLESFFKNRTVIVVAHRLSTVKHADQIVLLNQGEIAERGTHEELVSLRGGYFTLVKNQLELGA